MQQRQSCMLAALLCHALACSLCADHHTWIRGCVTWLRPSLNPRTAQSKVFASVASTNPFEVCALVSDSPGGCHSHRFLFVWLVFICLFLNL